MATDKQALRAEFRQILSEASLDSIHAWNESLALPLQEVLAPFAGASIGAYRARAREASLESIFGEAYRFCFPRVTGPGRMEFHFVPNPLEPTSFAPGYQGILEPLAQQPTVPAASIAVCLVPLLAFDEKGGRLGHGKGFYDRFLSAYSGLKVGIAFEAQRSKQALPIEPHDQPLDFVITESGIRDFRKA